MLINLLIQELRRLDSIESSSDCGINVMKCVNIVNEKSKVIKFLFRQKYKVSEMERLNGTRETMIVSRNRYLYSFFQNINEARTIQFLWTKLIVMYNVL